MRSGHRVTVTILLLLTSGWGCATAPQKTNMPPIEWGPGEALKRFTTLMQTPSEPPQVGVPTTAIPASPSMGNGGPAATYKYLLTLMENPAVKRQVVTSIALAPAPFEVEEPSTGSVPSPEPPSVVPSTPPATAMTPLPPTAGSEGISQSPPPAVLPLPPMEEARTKELTPPPEYRMETALMAGPAIAGLFEDALDALDRGDYKTAYRLIKPLAEHGLPEAQFNLGLMYDKQRGVPQDFAEAVKWYRKAAEQGNAEAQYNLGMMYFAGLGVPKDYALAHMWFYLATSRYPASEKAKRENAESSRDVAASKLTPSQVSEAQRMAREWKPKKEQ